MFELISEIGLSGAKPAVTSMELNQKLTAVELEYDIHVGKTDDPELVDVLSQFMQKPKHSHMGAPGLEILYKASNINTMIIYCDVLTGHLP